MGWPRPQLRSSIQVVFDYIVLSPSGPQFPHRGSTKSEYHAKYIVIVEILSFRLLGH